MPVKQNRQPATPNYTATCDVCREWIADFQHLDSLEIAVETGGGEVAWMSRNLDEIIVFCMEHSK